MHQAALASEESAQQEQNGTIGHGLKTSSIRHHPTKVDICANEGNIASNFLDDPLPANCSPSVLWHTGDKIERKDTHELANEASHFKKSELHHMVENAT